MVLLVADVHAEVVHHRRVLEPVALAVAQAVHLTGLVEQRQGDSRDLLGVLGRVVAALGQLHHAAPPHVGVAVGLRNLLPVAVDVVEDQPFAQRQVAERDVGRAKPPQNRVEQHRTGNDDVAALGFEAGKLQPLLEHRAKRPACAAGAAAGR